MALNRELRSVRRAFPGADARTRGAWRVSGIGPRRAAGTACELFAAGHATVACVGLAGGLSPDLECGDLVVGDAVLDAEGTELAVDGRWAEAVMARLRGQLPVPRGVIYSASAVVAEPRAKQDLFRRTGALVVDMESAAVVRAASVERRCVLTLRVVADGHDHALSQALLDLVDAHGNLRTGVALPRMLSSPGLVLDALRLAAQVSRAERALRRALALLGPDLACSHATR